MGISLTDLSGLRLRVSGSGSLWTLEGLLSQAFSVPGPDSGARPRPVTQMFSSPSQQESRLSLARLGIGAVVIPQNLSRGDSENFGSSPAEAKSGCGFRHTILVSRTAIPASPRSVPVMQLPAGPVKIRGVGSNKLLCPAGPKRGKARVVPKDSRHHV